MLERYSSLSGIVKSGFGNHRHRIKNDKQACCSFLRTGQLTHDILAAQSLEAMRSPPPNRNDPLSRIQSNRVIKSAGHAGSGQVQVRST